MIFASVITEPRKEDLLAILSEIIAIQKPDNLHCENQNSEIFLHLIILAVIPIPFTGEDAKAVLLIEISGIETNAGADEWFLCSGPEVPFHMAQKGCPDALL
jgi:hypothetical protein